MRHKRLQLSAILVLGLGLTGLYAQESTTAAGGNASGNGGTASYSVGQVAYQTYNDTGGSVSEGVQQAYEITVVNGLERALGIHLSVSAYPNPTTDFLTLSISDDVPTDCLASLYDIQGKLLQCTKIESNETTIDMSNLVPTTYFVKVKQDNTEVKTFKIVKN